MQRGPPLKGRGYLLRADLVAVISVVFALLIFLTTPVKTSPILSRTEGSGTTGASSNSSSATSGRRNETRYVDEAAPDAAGVLLQWKETLPRGSCLGCADGPLFSNWLRNQSVCSWNGTRAARGSLGAPPTVGVLECNETTQTFMKLDISGMNLSGPLPELFSKLVHLQILFTTGNRFTGTLPASWSEIGRLTDAVAIKVESNRLSGTLPPEWVVRQQAIQLELSKNQLSGTLPVSWSKGNLTRLELKSNQVTGTLPASYSAFRWMTDIYLDDNAMTGTLPPEWSTVGQLSLTGDIDIRLSDNRFTGTLPPEWVVTQPPTYIKVERNELNGTLPSSWHMGQLTKLGLEVNSITGTLPREWSRLSRTLEEVKLNGNQLTGTLPASWAALMELRTLELSFNYFNGSVPAAWFADFADIRKLQLAYNDIELPDENIVLPKDWDIKPQGATHPSEILLRYKATLPEGTCLGCKHGPVFRKWRRGIEACEWREKVEMFSGEMEMRGVTGCRDSTFVSRLQLDHMNLSGTVPEILGELGTLKDMHLEGNSLTGQLPDSWSAMGVTAGGIEL